MKTGRLLMFSLFIMAFMNISHANQRDETNSGGSVPEHECDHAPAEKTSKPYS